MKLSLVATLHRSAPHLLEFHERAGAAARRLAGDDYEIVLVNDGSPDDSLDLAVDLSKRDPRVVVVDLSRNFGHHKAIMTGLSHAHGERIFLIDSDLEEEPEWLMPFAEQMEREQCDVVYGVQEARRGGWFERASGHWFYFFLNRLIGLDIPANMMTARLMTRPYVDALLLHEEREVFLAGLFHLTGFVQRPRFVKKHSTSRTTYTLRRKLGLVLDSVTSFSAFPLIAIFYLGIAIFLLAGGYASYLLARWMVYSNAVSGWTSMMISIWLLGGMITCFIGIVGMYLSKVFSETKRRPYTIVRRVYGRESQPRPR